MTCGSRRTRASPARSRLCRSSARGSVSGRSRPSRISCSSTPPSLPPYVVFHDSVLHAIADAQPASLGELSQIAGVGPAKLERYGDAVLALL